MLFRIGLAGAICITLYFVRFRKKHVIKALAQKKLCARGQIKMTACEASQNAIVGSVRTSCSPVMVVCSLSIFIQENKVAIMKVVTLTY